MPAIVMGAGDSGSCLLIGDREREIACPCKDQSRRIIEQLQRDLVMTQPALVKNNSLNRYPVSWDGGSPHRRLAIMAMPAWGDCSRQISFNLTHLLRI